MNAARTTSPAPANQVATKPSGAPARQVVLPGGQAQAEQDRHPGGHEQLGLGQECQTDGQAAQEGVASRGRAVDPPGEEDAHQPEEQAMCSRVAIGTDVMKDFRRAVSAAGEQEWEDQGGDGLREGIGPAAE